MADALQTADDLRGKVVVVTGGNAGLGLATATALARRGATTVITARDRAKGDAAVATIRSLTTNDDVHCVDLDLASLASVRACADAVLQRWPRLDVLINNAGGIFSPRSETVDGFETIFGVNHLGPFLLTNLLLDPLRAAAPARIVHLSSLAYHFPVTGIYFDDLQSTRRFSSATVYGRAKIAVGLFSAELHRRHHTHGVSSYAVHPGFVRTSFAQDGDMPGFFARASSAMFIRTPEQGASATLWCAGEPGIESLSGSFVQNRWMGNWGKVKPVRVNRHLRSARDAERLWTESARLVGL